jgi:hypothetical protein
MTPNTESDIPRRVGRKKRWHQVMNSKFPAGTFERIAVVLKRDSKGEEREDRTEFVRLAVERELKRREKKLRPR